MERPLEQKARRDRRLLTRFPVLHLRMLGTRPLAQPLLVPGALSLPITPSPVV